MPLDLDMADDEYQPFAGGNDGDGLFDGHEDDATGADGAKMAKKKKGKAGKKGKKHKKQKGGALALEQCSYLRTKRQL